MKTCINCRSKVKEKDKYCRNCGCLIQSNINYIFLNIMCFVLIVGIIFLITLFIASYYIL